MGKFHDHLMIEKIYTALGILIVVAVVITALLNSSEEDADVVYYPLEDSSSVTDNVNSDNNSNNCTSSDSHVDSKMSTKTSKITTSVTTTTTTTQKIYNFPSDINTIDKEGLMQINGIGDTISQSIIDYRSSVGIIYNMDLLKNVYGIGELTLEKLKKFLYVSDADYRDMEIVDNSQEEVTTVTTTTTTAPTSENMETMESDTTTTTTVTQVSAQMKSVNINSATAEEIADCLLIDYELAQKIVELREEISYFTNPLELLYCKEIDNNMLSSFKEYIEV